MVNARLDEKAWNSEYYRVTLQPPSLASARVVVVFVLTDKRYPWFMTTSKWDFMARHLIMVCRLTRQVPSLSYFQPIRIQGVADDIVLKRAFPCARPFDRSPSRCSHRLFEPSFHIFQASTLFSFNLSYYSMAEPRVLVIGDSFIRRLRLFLSRDSHYFSVDFKLSHRAFIKWHRIGGQRFGN